MFHRASSWNNANPNPVSGSSNQSNYYQPPVYQPPIYGSQPNVTGYANQGMPPNNNGTPNQVPPQTTNRGFSIQQPINIQVFWLLEELSYELAGSLIKSD
jgi:hypothetical protein